MQISQSRQAFCFLCYSQRPQSGSSTHDVALVRIYNACLKCAARGSLK